jgi:hypothetical protein
MDERTAEYLSYFEFERRRDGMIHAMDGGLWLHRHVWKGRAMAHLVSIDRERLIAYGRAVGLPVNRLQFKPLKDPRTNIRRNAWHWDLVGRFLPPNRDHQPNTISLLSNRDRENENENDDDISAR